MGGRPKRGPSGESQNFVPGKLAICLKYDALGCLARVRCWHRSPPDLQARCRRPSSTRCGGCVTGHGCKINYSPIVGVAALYLHKPIVVLFPHLLKFAKFAFASSPVSNTLLLPVLIQQDQ